jgi:hypothetical protein
MTALNSTGLHHVRYRQNTRLGLGLALAIGSVISAIRQIVDELEHADGQRLVEIRSILNSIRPRSGQAG